jgi:hypothetical protein
MFVCVRQDKHGNPVDSSYSGEVTATITGPGSQSELPLLVGGTRVVKVELCKGQATLQVTCYPSFFSVRLMDFTS